MIKKVKAKEIKAKKAATKLPVTKSKAVKKALVSKPKAKSRNPKTVVKKIKSSLRVSPVAKKEASVANKTFTPSPSQPQIKPEPPKKIEAPITKKVEEKTVAKLAPSPVKPLDKSSGFDPEHSRGIKETIQPPVPPAEEIRPIVEASVAVEEVKAKILEFDLPIALKDLASKIGVKSNEIIMKLMNKNIFATINQGLGEEMTKEILKDYGIELRKPVKIEAEVVKEHREMEGRQDVKNIVTRPPVVTFMGHVDHGKTSLLDFIRKTRVADKEKGGITQHIGAYEVRLANGSVTFLDTPGHEAFTAMRARGASATDVVVLVVAADDGVMPQTKEAADHARAAGATIVVALNKCDLPGANIDKVKGQLSQIGLSPEDWGGKTVTVAVSAKTGEGVDKLLEMLLLESELLELKANPSLKARGVIIEGKLSSGQGPVATILVKNGT